MHNFSVSVREAKIIFNQLLLCCKDISDFESTDFSSDYMLNLLALIMEYGITG